MIEIACKIGYMQHWCYCRDRLALYGLLFILIFSFSKSVLAEAATAKHLDAMKPDIHNQASLQRGFGLYLDYCMGCHSLDYARYERTAEDIGIPIDIMESRLAGDLKVGNLMANNMPAHKAKQWFGVAPPDATLMARALGADHLYTYLRSFYKDSTRPTGVNNLVKPNIAMPHPLLPLQGLNECVADNHTECVEFKQVISGSMSADEYDKAVYDLVNFMVYVSEPAALVRYQIGYYVMLFLSLMLVFTWLLNREYWKDIT